MKLFKRLDSKLTLNLNLNKLASGLFLIIGSSQIVTLFFFNNFEAYRSIGYSSPLIVLTGIFIWNLVAWRKKE